MGRNIAGRSSSQQRSRGQGAHDSERGRVKGAGGSLVSWPVADVPSSLPLYWLLVARVVLASSFFTEALRACFFSSPVWHTPFGSPSYWLVFSLYFGLESASLLWCQCLYAWACKEGTAKCITSAWFLLCVSVQSPTMPVIPQVATGLRMCSAYTFLPRMWNEEVKCVLASFLLRTRENRSQCFQMPSPVPGGYAARLLVAYLICNIQSNCSF